MQRATQNANVFMSERVAVHGVLFGQKEKIESKL